MGDQSNEFKTIKYIRDFEMKENVVVLSMLPQRIVERVVTSHRGEAIANSTLSVSHPWPMQYKV